MNTCPNGESVSYQPDPPPPKRWAPAQRVGRSLLLISAALAILLAVLLVWLGQPIERTTFDHQSSAPAAGHGEAIPAEAVQSVPPALEDGNAAISAEDALRYIGQNRTVQMTVNDTGGLVHLYLYASASRANGTFIAVVDRDLVAQMRPGNVPGLKPHFLHKRLQIRGPIILRATEDGLKRPCIVVTDPRQMETLTP